MIALAADESSRHRPDGVATTATPDGDGFVLQGAKTFVVDGHVADRFIVTARMVDGATGLFLVDPKAAGVVIERTAMVDAHNAARVRFASVQVGSDALLANVARIVEERDEWC